MRYKIENRVLWVLVAISICLVITSLKEKRESMKRSEIGRIALQIIVMKKPPTEIMDVAAKALNEMGHER
jgi:hypothetical protein